MKTTYQDIIFHPTHYRICNCQGYLYSEKRKRCSVCREKLQPLEIKDIAGIIKFHKNDTEVFDVDQSFAI